MGLREKADKIFSWAKEQEICSDREFSAWVAHSFGAAKVAEEIAKRIPEIDTDRAYASGLLHDIGRYQGIKTGMYHIIAGYNILMQEDLPEIARISLTHSFYPKSKILEFKQIGNDKEWELVKKVVSESEYDDYDMLIQLADYMAGSHGVTTIERRFCSVLARHGLGVPRDELLSLLGLKDYFDSKVGGNIYELFREEIAESSIRSVAREFIRKKECLEVGVGGIRVGKHLGARAIDIRREERD